jgi:small nuclear ribonucleoprotein (snRNP)-like protein
MTTPYVTVTRGTPEACTISCGQPSSKGTESMIRNQIVVRYQDGRTLKGYTVDFLATRPTFRLMLIDAPQNARPLDVQLAEIKAIFFVKDFVGNRERKKVQEFPEGRPVVGRKIRVTFQDGETLVGTTQGYDVTRLGFFVVPADPGSNNDRCFVVNRATKEVSFI